MYHYAIDRSLCILHIFVSRRDRDEACRDIPDFEQVSLKDARELMASYLESLDVGFVLCDDLSMEEIVSAYCAHVGLGVLEG